MDYEKIDMGSYNLHFIHTNKFKTTTISVNFREKVNKEEITIRKFLFQMLCQTSKKYNTNRLFELKLEDLYSMNIGHSSTKFGYLINSYIDIKFLNEKYTSETFIYEALDFLFELIFNPNITDDKFDSKAFNIIKDKLALTIESLKENPEKYCLTKSLETLKDDPVSYSLWGYKEDLEKITEESLKEYYDKVLKTNKIDIFIVGNYNKDIVFKYFKEKFNINTIKMNNTLPYVVYDKPIKKKEYIEETNELNQSKLSIICKILNMSKFERRYVLPLYVSILGGDSNSRLFTNVREKKSLAYNINALSKGPNSLFIILAGINKEDYDTVIKIITNELKNMKKTISDRELSAAKNEMISSLETLLDSPGGIINYYFGIEVFNSEPIAEKIENYKKVTIKDIQNLANKVRIATIYLLKGNSNEET